jgi:hypothetical protein
LFFKLNKTSADLTTSGVIVTTGVGDDESESTTGALPKETINPFQVEPFAPNPVALYGTFAVAPTATLRKGVIPTVGAAVRKKVTDASKGLVENELRPIVVTESGIVTEVRASLLEKAVGPIVMTEFGILIEASRVQPSHRPSLITVTEFGIEREVSAVLSSKAYIPIVVTESGIVTKLRAALLEKAN